MSEAARSRRDDARYEPTLLVPGRETAARDAGSPDPLAELARLVGQDDPYRSVFRTAAAPHPVAARHDQPVYDDARHGADHHDPHGAADPYEAEAQHGWDQQDYDAHGYESADPYHDDAAEAQAEAHTDDYATEHAYAPGYEAGLAATHGTDGQGAGVLPDLWARGQEAGPGAAPAIERGGAPPDRGPIKSSARRPLAVLASVLLLTVGGLAATFLVKGSSSANVASSASGRGTPTILAATGPTKVKVDDGSATAPEDQDAALLNKTGGLSSGPVKDAALLNKTGGLSSGPVKIVSSQEQPADLGQLPKSDLADGARPLPAPSASPFPEPKRVKTFLVHPDGSMLSGDGAAAATAPSAPAAAAAPAALPATPKTAARGGTTPQAAAAPVSIASLSADPAPADTAPTAAVAAPVKPARQAASPGVHQASAKPTDTAAALASGGGYGVQLASSPNEADANAAFAKLKKKYPTQLGPYSATVHKAETGDRPVYRVRIGGMSQDEAKTLCSQLQSAGGSCFVMHN